MTSAVARAYEAERRRVFYRRTIVASVLGMVLVPLFGVTDYFRYRPYFWILVTPRLLSGVASLFILLILRYPLGRRHAAALAAVLSLEVGLAIASVPVAITGADTPYVSMSLLILSLAALLPWTPAQSAFLSAILAASFIGGGLLHGVSGASAFATQVSAVLVTGVIALVITTLSEAMRRRECAARLALRTASREKTRLIRNLEQKTGELAALNHQLGNLNREMEDFLYVASHDLRAPLINIQGFTNELRLSLSALPPANNGGEAKGMYDDIEESLRFIHSATSRMDGLIGGLLGLSRITARTNPHEVVDLQSVVEKIVESFRYQLDQHCITVTVGPLPAVRGEALGLNQVFSNLVDNAIKYMGDRPVCTIGIGVGDSDGAPAFYVRDSGPGIPRESQETVFRLFRRLGTSVPGEGLGLTMVRRIVEKHGGRIWIESTPGQGTTFWFTLDGSCSEGVGQTRSSGHPSDHEPEVVTAANAPASAA